MVYDMSHILLGDIRVTQVQDSYLTFKREKSVSLGSEPLKRRQLPGNPNMASKSNKDLVPA